MPFVEMTKINEISIRLNNLMSKITPDSIDEAYNIIDKHFNLSSKFPPFTFEKCMLKMLSKVYHPNMYFKLENIIEKYIYHYKNKKEFSNIFIPFCILKYKYKNEIDENIGKFLNLCDLKFKNKLGKIMSKQKMFDTNPLNNIKLNINPGNFYDRLNFSNCLTKHTKTDKSFNFIDQKNFTYDFFYIDNYICNFEFSRQSGDFYEFYNKKIIIQNSSQDKFFQLMNLFLCRNFIQCKNLIKDILENAFLIQKLHLYNLVVYCYFNLGMYQESVYYIDKCLDMSEITYQYFIHYKFLIERYGKCHGPCSKLSFVNEFCKSTERRCTDSLETTGRIIEDKYNVCLTNNINFCTFISSVNNIDKLKLFTNLNFLCINNRLINNFIIENKIDAIRELRNLEENAKLLIKNLENEYLVISVHCINNLLHFNINFNHFVPTNIDYNLIGLKYQLILRRNRDSFYEKNKVAWWRERIKLDFEMKELMCSVNYDLGIKTSCIILILDEKTSEFPFEHTRMFYKYQTYRILSSEFLYLNINNKKNEFDLERQTNKLKKLDEIENRLQNNGFYKIDTEIKEKQTLFCELSKSRNCIDNNINIDKIVAKDKKIQLLENVKSQYENNLNALKYKFIIDETLQNTYQRITNVFTYLNEKDANCICYFGHGNGKKHIPNEKGKIIFLFGCSSVKLICRDNFKKNSSILNHIKNNRIVLGCLYEMTDKDLDIFSIELLQSNGDLSSIVKRAQSKMKLRWLNGCSIIIYGMPFMYKSNIKK